MRLLYILAILTLGCTSEDAEEQKSGNDNVLYSAPLPEELLGISNKLIVEHNADTIFATLNGKDPEKFGKYQLQFTTSVSSPKDEVKITEFGAYLLENDEWVFKSIYDRPFNANEFEKWYQCPSAVLQIGVTYSDQDNWLAKTNTLDGRVIHSLWYFKGLENNGKEVIGISEIVGVLNLK